MPTIRDVAKRAGVSTATVSHVINKTRHVEPLTRQLVVDAIDALNYRPSAVARGLTTSSTQTIGVVIADVTSPFFAFLLRAIEDLIFAHRYNLYVCSTHEDPAREAHYLELLSDKRVDGILMTPTGIAQPIYAQLHEQQVPLVFIDRQPPDAPGAFVGTDNRLAAYRATQHLINLGHRRIALTTLLPETSNVQARTQGYQQALQAANISPDDALLAPTPFDLAAATRIMQSLLASAERPSALITASHISTLGALRAMQALGLRYPDDVSLVCFDNSRWTDLVQPQLTVVRKPIQALAQAAVDTVLSAIAAYAEHRRDKTYRWTPPPDALLATEMVIQHSSRPYDGAAAER